jgi:hypothetical protein
MAAKGYMLLATLSFEDATRTPQRNINMVRLGDFRQRDA